MSSLRVLLVHPDLRKSQEIAAILAQAHHTALFAASLEEAADMLAVERFDAVLIQSAGAYGMREFILQLRRMELRSMEVSQKSAAHIPLFALSSGSNRSHEDAAVDAVLQEPFEAQALTDAITQLAKAVGGASPHTALDSTFVEILNCDKFREQVGSDDALMVEIIDLFLEERKRQEPEMRSSLESGKLDVLSRVAHTIKGSLGSLHAMRARAHAQELEFAAKRGDKDICLKLLTMLQDDLAELEPALVELRRVSVF